MPVLWVWIRHEAYRLGRHLKEADGLTIIEYVAFAAVVVLVLVTAAALLGPTLKDWMGSTMCAIMKGDGAVMGADGKCTGGTR